jgi:alpha-glucoside transport system permease protein
MENYRYALTNELNTESAKTTWESFWTSSYGNNIKWLLVMVTGTVGIGLIFAVLVDRIKREALAKAIIFMPMAISFVGAGVIWKFVYNYGTSQVQTGILNAVITGLGFEPIAWLSKVPLNTFMLIIVGIWMWTGFCMTLLSSAIKSIPEEIIEASRIDGATNFEIFSKVQVPIIAPTIIVVITTMVINVLKLFDIVYVMTGGNFGTNVIATRMYTEMYTNAQYGRGTAIAVILILFIIPFIVMNIRRFTKQEAMR